MMNDKRKLFIIMVLVLLDLNLFECRRSGGGSGRRSSSRVTTSSPNRRTTAYHRDAATYQSAQKVTTPRYNIQTQQSYPSYNQPNYNQPHQSTYNQPNYNQPHQPSYNQPNYNQPGYNNQPHYNQPGYNQPHYNQPGYNQPHFNQPGYNQPFPNNNYQSSGGLWQQKKDHSVRNSVLAGVGGSALGLYLGYKLGGLTNSNSGPNYIGGPGGATGGGPQYSVVHHYYHGDKPIPKESKVEAGVIKKCDNVNFCTTNTQPLCMTNGTVYCTASLESTIICNENSTEMRCVNSTITLPCDNSTNCGTTALNTTSISIPCVTIIDVFGDFGSNMLSVQKVSKRSAEIEPMENSTSSENITSSTTETSNSTSDMTTTPGSVSSMAPLAPLASTDMPVQRISNSPSSTSALTSQGISNKFCVTVIAEPIKEVEEKPNMSNEEFAKLASSNQNVMKEIKNSQGRLEFNGYMVVFCIVYSLYLRNTC